MGKLKKALWTGASLAAVEIANLLIEQRSGPVHNTLGGEGDSFPWRMGSVFYTCQGQGEPVVMLHGIHAAASSYEWRKNFGPLAEKCQVYALDLLGFGLSDRPPVTYTAQTYVELISDFLREIVGRPATVIASSLSAAYAISAAQRYPETIKRLILVNPTGIDALAADPEFPQRLFLRLMRSPIVGTAIFNAVASRSFIAWYLRKRAYENPALATREVIRDNYNCAHQLGAKWAPSSFLAGYLNLDIYWPWTQLEQPITLVWGRNAMETPLQQADQFLKLRPTTRLEVFEGSRLLPHEEQQEQFNKLVLDLLRVS